MAPRRKATLFPFATPRYHHREITGRENSAQELPNAEPESRREAVLEKLLRRAMRRVWTVALPDDNGDTILKDRSSVCRLLRMTDPLREGVE